MHSCEIFTSFQFMNLEIYAGVDEDDPFMHAFELCKSRELSADSSLVTPGVEYRIIGSRFVWRRENGSV